MNTLNSAAPVQLNRLISFRQDLYCRLGPACDALIELTDALLLTANLPSLAHLALAPVFRRQWPSVYAALDHGKPDHTALLQLFVAQLAPTQAIHPSPRLLFAGDVTNWPMPYGRSMAERGFWHQAQAIPSDSRVTVGHGYSTIAWVPELRGSWALPLLQQRINPDQTPVERAAEQLQLLYQQLSSSQRDLALAMYDSGYGGAKFLRATAAIPIDKLIRLRPNLVLFAAPPPYNSKGRPRKHGAAFGLKDPSSWGEPAEVQLSLDSKGQPVRVELWRGLHFRDAAEISFDVARVSRQATKAAIKGKELKPQWLAWVSGQGKPAPAVGEWWWLYGRRYPIEHLYRLEKGQLQWLLPQLGKPERCETWSDVVSMAVWQLWLAREVVAEQRLPWQQPQAPEERTPGRVRAGLGAVMAAIGTPAKEPKRRGKSPGWPVGKPRKARAEQKVVYKGGKKRKKPPKQRAAAAK